MYSYIGDPKNNIPTVFIILGATGDLVSKKVMPALFNLFSDGRLPELFKIIGFSRTEIGGEGFRDRVKNGLVHHFKSADVDSNKIEAFISHLDYQRSTFADLNGYRSLSIKLEEVDQLWGLCSSKLLYLATPPNSFEEILNNLSKSGLNKVCGGGGGWTRIILEKPFGEDLKSARKLEKLLGKLFNESQIYRIDHYLAKEMTQNILSFRFSNNIFYPSWNKRFIERIKIRVLEENGVEERGNFYDNVGALKDFGPNHILQMLALVTMDHPVRFDAESIRKNRAKILSRLINPSVDYIKKNTFRAQYKGYKSINGVRENSETETYFKIKTFLNSTKFKGIPIILESGKRMGKIRKDISIIFRHPTPCLCPGANHYKNKIVISLEPEEAITIQFGSKKTGFNFELEERFFGFNLYADAGDKIRSRAGESYEKLLLDCIAGDQTLFVSTQEIISMWKFIDPIIRAWKDKSVELYYYKPDSSEASDLSKNMIEEETGIVNEDKVEINDQSLFPIQK
ncbi:MAG TPA: glucose-6-phosphate dehydrogenase [Candidatus Paceibacterota bacterium]